MVTNIQVENYGKFHQELYLQKKKKINHYVSRQYLLQSRHFPNSTYEVQLRTRQNHMAFFFFNFQLISELWRK
jgi:type II secretory pathway component PulK